MAGSTWTWNGGSAAGSSTNWRLLSGAGNTKHYPVSGDTAIIPDGTVDGGVDPSLVGNTIEVGGTSGTVAALSVSGDAFTNFATPSADAATLIDSAVPGHSTAETSVLNAGGVTVNEGTILANGPAGSVFTINVAPTLIGTATPPGYFFNAGTIIADAGNTLIINVGSGSELFNSGSIVADGGTVVIDVAAGAIAGGIAAEAAFYVIENGGTLETQASYPLINGNQPGGTTPRYEFANATQGNTLKIDNLGSFSGSVIGFQTGDTVDLGTSLAVGTLVYSTDPRAADPGERGRHPPDGPVPVGQRDDHRHLRGDERRHRRRDNHRYRRRWRHHTDNQPDNSRTPAACPASGRTPLAGRTALSPVPGYRAHRLQRDHELHPHHRSRAGLRGGHFDLRPVGVAADHQRHDGGTRNREHLRRHAGCDRRQHADHLVLADFFA